MTDKIPQPVYPGPEADPIPPIKLDRSPKTWEEYLNDEYNDIDF